MLGLGNGTGNEYGKRIGNGVIGLMVVMKCVVVKKGMKVVIVERVYLGNVSDWRYYYM